MALSYIQPKTKFTGNRKLGINITLALVKQHQTLSYAPVADSDDFLCIQTHKNNQISRYNGKKGLQEICCVTN